MHYSRSVPDTESFTDTRPNHDLLADAYWYRQTYNMEAFFLLKRQKFKYLAT